MHRCSPPHPIVLLQKSLVILPVAPCDSPMKEGLSQLPSKIPLLFSAPGYYSPPGAGRACLNTFSGSPRISLAPERSMLNVGCMIRLCERGVDVAECGWGWATDGPYGSYKAERFPPDEILTFLFLFFLTRSINLSESLSKSSNSHTKAFRLHQQLSTCLPGMPSPLSSPSTNR